MSVAGYIAGAALVIAVAALAVGMGALDRWVVFYDPKPRGWKYWPWAWRYWREHGDWPV